MHDFRTMFAQQATVQAWNGLRQLMVYQAPSLTLRHWLPPANGQETIHFHALTNYSLFQ